MATEIEHKFLVQSDSWKKTADTGKLYMQGYMGNRPTVRARVVEDKGFITMKSKVSKITRIEYEYEIPVDDAIDMLENFTKGDIVEKMRHLCVVGGKTWEIDVFFGLNEGLILAEIELESEDEEFELPDWAGECVSGDSRYSNSNLSQVPYYLWGHKK